MRFHGLLSFPDDKQARWNARTQRAPEHLHWLQLPSGLEPMLLVIARFLSSGEPDFVGLGGNIGIGRMDRLLPGWLGRCNACRRG